MSVNNYNQEVAEARKEDGLKEKPEKRLHYLRIRLIPIWLRVIIVIILMVLGAISGAAVGYGALGNGKVSDIFQKETWTHIVDIVEKE